MTKRVRPCEGLCGGGSLSESSRTCVLCLAPVPSQDDLGRMEKAVAIWVAQWFPSGSTEKDIDLVLAAFYYEVRDAVRNTSNSVSASLMRPDPLPLAEAPVQRMNILALRRQHFSLSGHRVVDPTVLNGTPV